MFLDCPFIDIINRKQAKRKDVLFSSAMVNEEIEDWKYIHQFICEHFEIQVETISHTYVDLCNKPKRLMNQYCVIARGMINNKWVYRKDPGDAIYRYIIELISQDRQIVFIGTQSDYNRYINKMAGWAKNSIVIINDMRSSLGAIAYCDFMVSNDTGMYHAAGALNKDVFVMWKHTPFIKNRSPGNYCKFSFIRHWKSDFDEWYRDRRLKTNEMSGNGI
jgi:hypothetical protein